MIALQKAISGIGRTLNLPTYVLKPHQPNPDFYGREDVLQELENILSPQSGTHLDRPLFGLKTFALCGTGGVGKTQIAVEYAYKSKGDFDAIFFLQADDTTKLAQGFADISLALGLEAQAAAEDQAVSRDLVLGWLSQPMKRIQEGSNPVDDAAKPDATWLIIFDNADDLSILADYWPVTGTGSVLVTSRDPLAKSRAHIPVDHGLDLEPLSVSEGGSLLRQITGIDKEKDVETSITIATKLSGLPLAINQIARTISRRNLSFEEFLELYNDQSIRSEIYQSKNGLDSKSLYTLWAFEDLSSVALGLLNIVSFLDPDRISEKLLSATDSCKKAIFTNEDYPVSTQTFIGARTELTKSSLLKRNIDLEELLVHRIIQDIVRTRMSLEIFQSTFDNATGLLHCSWPFSEFEHSTQRWLLCEPLVSHINNIHSIFKQTEVLNTSTARRPKFAQLLMEFGW